MTSQQQQYGSLRKHAFLYGVQAFWIRRHRALVECSKICQSALLMAREKLISADKWGHTSAFVFYDSFAKQCCPLHADSNVPARTTLLK
jgi:hypothetical protein